LEEAPFSRLWTVDAGRSTLDGPDQSTIHGLTPTVPATPRLSRG
jgi:hypothetical protein